MRMEKWWKEAVIYQIYPRSFYDSNGDGIGDINGITAKLDYLKYLGIDVIWLSPVYKSPNDDNGYDISNYQEIMDDFGTLSDWQRMLDEMHKRGIKLIMDLVINHTSDEHPWFIESRLSKDNPKRNYYIWRDGKNGKEPNNWQAFFSEPAWEYDSKTDQYYLHLFSKKQPDLNWENPELKQEIFSMVKWWLDMGIDGFRMDVINLIAKPKSLPDSELLGKDFSGYVFDSNLYANNEASHEYLHEMNESILNKYNIMTVGETPSVTPEIALKYVDEKRAELDMVFSFEHVPPDDFILPPGKLNVYIFLFIMKIKKIVKGKNRIDAVRFKSIMKKWYTVIEHGGWNSQYFSNHDQPRQVSRFADDKKYRERSAKMLATLIHTLPGTPYVYQGEELGMTNVDFKSMDDYRDVAFFNSYKKHIKGGIPKRTAFRLIQPTARDNARTPMQWNAEQNAGFTNGKPWINVNPNYKNINAEAQKEDEKSVLNYYRKLIELRKNNKVMVYGNFRLIDKANKKTIAYIKEYNGDKWLIAINLANKPAKVKIKDDFIFKKAETILSNTGIIKNITKKSINLMPYESIVFKIF